MDGVSFALIAVKMQDRVSICDRSGHARDAPCAGDRGLPCVLLRADAAGRRLHLDTGEYGELTAHHFGRDGNGAPAD